MEVWNQAGCASFNTKLGAHYAGQSSD